MLKLFRLINESLFKKLLLAFVSLLTLEAAFLYFSMGETFSFSYLLVTTLFFSIFFFLFFWIEILRPLNKILDPVQSLLAGHSYKRIYSKRIDEIGILANFFNSVTTSIGEVSHSIKDRERILEELNVASQLQKDILPLKTPPVNGLDVVAKNKPATELGGDSFDVYKNESKVFIYVGDVTGHGVAAGLMMTMVSTLIRVFADLGNSAYEIMVVVNKYIKKHVKKSMFMTMVLFCWDEDKQKLSYVGAGHEHIIIYRKSLGQCETIMSGGVALGMVPNNRTVIKEKEIELDQGDFIVLYSDGITEARNKKGELFGLERLVELVQEYGAQYSIEGVNYHIAKRVSDFMEGHVQEDDMTLIVFSREMEQKRKPLERKTDWE